MKQKLLCIMVLLSLSLVGCSNSTNDINVMKADKAETVVKSEYVSRMKRAVENKKSEEYKEKYSESEIIDELMYGGERDSYKDFIEDVSTFRTEDEDINKLHDKMIEVSLDLYNMYDEEINLGIEEEDIYNKSEELKRDITDDEDAKLDEIMERKDVLKEMIDNQEEHLQNITEEIGNTLGLN